MKNFYNPNIDLLVEKFKSLSRESWIKFSIQRHYKSYLFKDKKKLSNNLYKFAKNFLSTTFNFQVEKTELFEFERDRAECLLWSILSYDLHGYEYWDNKNAEKLSEYFVSEFLDGAKFYSNCQPGDERATVSRADHRKPVWENGLVAIDKKKIGAIWISIHDDIYSIKLVAKD